MVALPGTEEKFTQPSSVTDAGRSDGSSGAAMVSLVPLNEKACPTLPATVLKLPVALFGPVLSFPFPSALNQLMMFAGAAKQLDGPAVRFKVVELVVSVNVPPG